MAEAQNPQTHRRTDADAIAELGARATRLPLPVPLKRGTTDDVLAVAVPNERGGFDLKSGKAILDEYRLTPERIRGTANLADLASFIAHANRFKVADSSVLFANPDRQKPSLVSVLNYHRPASEPEAEPGEAQWTDHRGVYAFPLSDQWKAWTKAQGKDNAMGQEAFAMFLEDRINDVAAPAADLSQIAADFAKNLGGADAYATPQKLLELSRGLSVRVGQKVGKAVNLGSGETQITFHEEHTDAATGAPLKIPTAFLIQIPVFQSGALYEVPARLRYRISGPQIAWWFDLASTDRVFDDAFQEACTKAATDTGLPLFVGTPEA